MSDKILDVDIAQQMQTSYIEYAMSVIVARALPDVRDGLKPVHRRILYSMAEMGLEPNKGHKKSARIVGDTMAKYHPHGDASIYDAMVRMAQDFSMRYPLVDGHGNFGSMDGDGAAAHRYTEARLARLTLELLEGINQDTVNFAPNYDGESQEPTVLPARFPNLLVNGTSGIAVGMATNIPPHNLRDVISAVLHIIQDRIAGNETDIHKLVDIVKAPDFPTGGAILGTAGIKSAYLTGRGKGTLRAIGEIMPMPKATNREMIVFTKIPYQVNKAKLVERMAELVKDKKIDGISDIRDESNRDGVRIVVELRKDANANVVLNQLYKYSALQENFSILMLALDKNQPKVMNLKTMLSLYLDHQEEVITRRTNFELNKAKRRAHILEGYLKALESIDDLISIIRGSQDTANARANLQARFDFSPEQAAAIVEMRLRALTSLEKTRLQQEYTELQAVIQNLTQILNDKSKLYAVISEELIEIQKKYGDNRRTEILHNENEGEILIEDLIDDVETVITMSNFNYIKRMSLDTYRTQRRGGKGVIGMQTREEDIVKDLIVANTHDYILFFTNMGKAYRIKAYEIPEVGRTAKGIALVNLLNLSAGESVAAIIPMNKNATQDNSYLTMVTRKGIIKKTSLELYSNIRKQGLIALNIREDDSLITVLHSYAGQTIIVAAASGKGVHFSEESVRAMGRTASGVKAMNLNEDDYIIGATVVEENSLLLFVSAGGFGKRTPAEEFTIHNRGGKGMIAYKPTEKTGNLIGIAAVKETDELLVINSEGIIIRTPVSSISISGRTAIGVKLIKMDAGVTVASMAKIADVGENAKDSEELEVLEVSEDLEVSENLEVLEE
ncbi:MAG: DNA gyrase subunit A [Firmicutes bacterium]|nr:DNA gyrase subunit A [Bacillota bacterium]